jgi:hypothetical protein
VTVGWVAADEHAYDLEQLRVREALERLLARHAHVRVAAIGIALGLPADRCQHLRRVHYFDLAGHVAAWDVGIAPLADIPFNRARSDVKLKEYAAVGVPWLASPIGPYAGLGEKQGGRLVTDDRWYEELERLVTDERARRKLAKRGLKWGASKRVQTALPAWEAVVETALQRARAS